MVFPTPTSPVIKMRRFLSLIPDIMEERAFQWLMARYRNLGSGFRVKGSSEKRKNFLYISE
jgi:hypothetical protein